MRLSPPGRSGCAFRGDIQALRGLAVMLVVLYHAGLPGPAAGYLGVDVFFVVSGFLITNLIRRELDGGSFSFGRFYYRRAKRLLPAAYAVLILVALAAPYFVSELELENFRAQTFGAVTFTTNLVLWRQTDYFGGDADAKVLLHFWSLAVEEQYYLLMPALLVFIPRRAWVPSIVGCLIASGLFYLYLMARDPTAAFYLLPARAWELALGSLGALLPPRVTEARVLSRCRPLALVVLLCVAFLPTGLPSPLTLLLACSATLMVILGGDPEARRSDGTNPLWVGAIWIGNISYSLYLVHWPIFVFTRAAWLDEPPVYAWIIALAFSIGLSWLLYRFLEEPFRQGFEGNRQRLLGGLAIASLLIAVAPGAIIAATATGVDYAQLRQANRGIDKACSYKKSQQFNGISRTCKTNSAPRILIWGDSIAMAWTSALVEPLAEFGVEQVTKPACGPLIGMAYFPKLEIHGDDRERAKSCIDFNQRVLNYVRSNSDLEVVVISAAFQSFASTKNRLLSKIDDSYRETEIYPEQFVQGIKSLVDSVRAAGKKVVIIEPPPANGLDIGECLERRAKHTIMFGVTGDCSLSTESVERHFRGTWELLDFSRLKSRT